MNSVALIPLRDIEIINSELILADISALEKRKESRIKKARSGDKEAVQELALIEKLLPHLDTGKPALTLEISDDEKVILRDFFLLSSKRTIFACNVAEDELADAQKNPDAHAMVARVRDHAAASHGAEAVVISARIEEELVELAPDEAQEFPLRYGHIRLGSFYSHPCCLSFTRITHLHH